MGKKNDTVKQISILNEIDKTLDDSYESLRDEIEAMQIRIAIADREADRKIRKKLKKNPNMIVNNRKKISIRNQILNEMEESNFIDRVVDALQVISPMIIIIARMCAALIQLLLSLDCVRRNIPESFLTKLMNLYEFCAGLRIA